MKIIGIGRNYTDHAKELNNPVPDSPVVFLKPDTALLKNNAPFYHPDFSSDIHHEVEIIIRIEKEGKNIDPKFAHKYYSSVGIGIDFTARELKKKLKTEGLPWDICKGFNHSAPISSFLPKENFQDLQNLNFHLEVNNKVVQEGNTKDMIFSIDRIIAYVSKFFTLKKGDIIFTGTPKGVGKVNIKDRLSAYIEGQKLLDFEIK